MSALKSSVLLAVAALAGAAACSLGGETIVNMTEAADTDVDAGAAAPAGKSVGAAAGAACEGVFAKADLSKAKACESGGHCWEKAKMPASLQQLFAPCDAGGPGDVCVPDEILTAGGSKLPQCTQPDAVKAAAGPGGGCVTLALLPEVQKQAGAFLKQQECGAGQACIPCKNPQDNSDTPFCEPIGVYADTCSGGGSDAGAQATSAPPAAPGPSCCSSHGACMSASVLPADKKDSMPRDTCPKDDVCMPAAMMQGKATPCDAGLLFGPGVCLDECFNAMLAVGGFFGVLSSDGCGSKSEICTPCSILKDEMPAGVPVPGCE